MLITEKWEISAAVCSFSVSECSVQRVRKNLKTRDSLMHHSNETGYHVNITRQKEIKSVFCLFKRLSCKHNANSILLFVNKNYRHDFEIKAFRA